MTQPRSRVLGDDRAAPRLATRDRVADERSSRGRPATRARILAAARLLFGKQGFAATTVKDIARECDITDAALYYYFRSKREILDSLWGPLPESPAEEPIRGDSLDDLTDEVLDGIAQREALFRIVLRQALAGDRTALALRDQTMAGLEENLFRRLRTSFGDDEARELADSLCMLFLGLYHNSEIELGEDFAAVLGTPQFRERARALVRTVAAVGVDTATAAEPCAP